MGSMWDNIPPELSHSSQLAIVVELDWYAVFVPTTEIELAV
jgi:hypothetical protein